jgi:1-acyl-sn-glycerol-3-phosphate acyltransferase
VRDCGSRKEGEVGRAERHGRYERAGWRYRFLSAFAAVLLAPFVRLELVRMDLARTENGIVVCNHRSMVDVLIGLVAFRRLRRYPRVAVAGEYFRRPGLGWALRFAGAIPVERNSPAGTVRRVNEVAQAGIPVVILAEGRLHCDPDDPTTTAPFKTGAARIAHQCELPIWLIAIAGTDKVWPPDKAFPRVVPFRRKTVQLLGAPELLYTDGEPQADTGRVRAEVEALLIELAKR